MLFLIDNKNKIIFGWSAKCGCSHIKSIYLFLQNDKINPIHGKWAKGNLSDEILNSIENYTTIIICRNPYKRLVSGFLDKYRINGEFRHRWPDKNINFNKFVNRLGNWKFIEKHHFTPQTTENFNYKIMNSKIIKLFDIENIDYNYIEELYNKKIPTKLIKFKGGHTRDKMKLDSNIQKNVYDLDTKEYYNSKVEVKYFYNDELKQKVYEFYKKDFLFFNKYGLNYELKL
jgi:hypothetical protein